MKCRIQTVRLKTMTVTMTMAITMTMPTSHRQKAQVMKVVCWGAGTAWSTRAPPLIKILQISAKPGLHTVDEDSDTRPLFTHWGPELGAITELRQT